MLKSDEKCQQQNYSMNNNQLSQNTPNKKRLIFWNMESIN